MRIERDLGVGRRAVLRQYFIYMERIDSALTRVANINNVTAKIAGERQVLGVGGNVDTSGSVCTLVGVLSFQKIRFT